MSVSRTDLLRITDIHCLALILLQTSHTVTEALRRDVDQCQSGGNVVNCQHITPFESQYVCRCNYILHNVQFVMSEITATDPTEVPHQHDLISILARTSQSSV